MSLSEDDNQQTLMLQTDEEKIPRAHKRLLEDTWLPFISMNIAFWEFIVTSVYQFYFLGFALSFGMFFGSAVYIWLKWRDYNIWLANMEASNQDLKRDCWCVTFGRQSTMQYISNKTIHFYDK